ncbi:MAG: hypothetical protein HC804_02180 [Anaerolineae bacterium]|nr:hypothetical protein [Anaerolineae bacterium]
MASDLVLRLCQVDESEGGLPGAGLSPQEPDYDPATAHIATNDFVSALFSILHGAHTVAQVKAFYSMPANQQTQFDGLWAVLNTNGAPNMATKMMRYHRFQAILNFWERNYDLQIAAYDTPDEIEAFFLAIA